MTKKRSENNMINDCWNTEDTSEEKKCDNDDFFWGGDFKTREKREKKKREKRTPSRKFATPVRGKDRKVTTHTTPRCQREKEKEKEKGRGRGRACAAL